MTQDQYGQPRGPGYVVRDDAVPDDETEEFPTGESKPMTRFQKVASVLRGSGPEQDEQDQTAAGQVASGQVASDTGPITREAQPRDDYWDAPRAAAADRDEAAAVTSPDRPATETGTDPLTRQDEMTGSDAADHPATQPDMFGTTARAGNGATPATGAPATGAPASDPTGPTGRHAAAVGADTESRPGEAAGTIGDFSDLTYGNLIPDAAQYTEQWQQVQFKFVDDPHASVTEAADIVAQVTGRLEAAIQERQRAIEERQHAIAEQQRSLRGRWGEGANADTEALRETLRMYKTFLDQLIGSRVS